MNETCWEERGRPATAARRRERSFEVLCHVTVSHTFENVSAHVDIEGIEINPGDRILVWGPPLNPAFGEVQIEVRRATVTRAHWLERLWLRLTGNLDCLSLLEVSFSEKRML